MSATGLVVRLSTAAWLITMAGNATARDAQCRIERDDRVVLDRVCDFLPDRGDGSFALSARGREGPLFADILSVSVAVIEPGVADVRGLTQDGISSRWGEARRSVQDRACWTGADFNICAR